jgi:hypothetical protein
VQPRSFVASNPEFALTDIAVPQKFNGKNYDDSFFIVFAMPPEPAVVIAVQRVLSLYDSVKKTGPLEAAYLSALEEKYGKPSSVKVDSYNNGTKAITSRWLYSGDEDCNPDSAYINFPEGYLPPMFKHPNNLPDPDKCKGSLHVRLLVTTSGEYQGVASQALSWLANDGDLYLNQSTPGPFTPNGWRSANRKYKPEPPPQSCRWMRAARATARPCPPTARRDSWRSRW